MKYFEKISSGKLSRAVGALTGSNLKKIQKYKNRALETGDAGKYLKSRKLEDKAKKSQTIARTVAGIGGAGVLGAGALKSKN
jgi:hypothetical protein